MRYILQQIVISGASLYLTSLLFPGLVITGGTSGFFTAAVLFAIGLTIVKPVLNTIALPLNILTLGLFSCVVTMFVLYLLTIIDHNVSVSAFVFPGFSFFFIKIPSFSANLILSYTLISVTIQLVARMFVYIFDL